MSSVNLSSLGDDFRVFAPLIKSSEVGLANTWALSQARYLPSIKNNEGPGRRDRALISSLANLIDELSPEMLAVLDRMLVIS